MNMFKRTLSPLGNSPWLVGLSVWILTMACITPCYATAMVEGDQDNGATAVSSVQLIEGGQIQSPPSRVSPLQGSVTMSGANGNADPALPDISAMIARYNHHLDSQEVGELSQTINLLSNNYNLNPRLLASLVAVESSFRPQAVSPTGALGLGQLKPDTARWLGVNDPFDPIQNLMGVAKYLRYLLDRYNGSVAHALAAYYRGQGTIDRQGIDAGALYYIGKVGKALNGP